MLGLGDQHGRAAIEWTVDNLNASFEICENDRNVLVQSFTDGKIVDFGSDLGQKRAYRFLFKINKRLPVRSAFRPFLRAYASIRL